MDRRQQGTLHMYDTYQNARILLIDANMEDAHWALHGLERYLDHKRIQWARSSEEALERLYGSDNKLPSLIVMDLRLPGMDGKTVLRQLKKNSTTSGIPVVIFTASITPEELMACYDLGAVSYISKAVERERFAELVDMLWNYWLATCRLPTVLR